MRHKAVGWMSVMVLILVGPLLTACGTTANGAVFGIVRRQVGGPTQKTSDPPAKVLVTQQGSLVKSETANSIINCVPLLSQLVSVSLFHLAIIKSLLRWQRQPANPFR